MNFNQDGKNILVAEIPRWFLRVVYRRFSNFVIVPSPSVNAKDSSQTLERGVVKGARKILCWLASEENLSVGRDRDP